MTYLFRITKGQEQRLVRALSVELRQALMEALQEGRSVEEIFDMLPEIVDSIQRMPLLSSDADAQEQCCSERGASLRQRKAKGKINGSAGGAGTRSSVASSMFANNKDTRSLRRVLSRTDIKIFSILALGHCLDRERICEMLCHPHTLRSYEAKYFQGSLEDLLRTHHKGRVQGLLTREQEHEIRSMIGEDHDFTAKQVGTIIEERFGVRYNVRSVRKMLHRWGRPRPSQDAFIL